MPLFLTEQERVKVTLQDHEAMLNVGHYDVTLSVEADWSAAGTFADRAYETALRCDDDDVIIEVNEQLKKEGGCGWLVWVRGGDRPVYGDSLTLHGVLAGPWQGTVPPGGVAATWSDFSVVEVGGTERGRAAVTDVWPASGPVGTEVTLDGAGFGSVDGAVYLGGISQAIVSWSDTEVVFSVGTGTAPGNYLLELVTSTGEPSDMRGFSVTT